jgi:hypothetical protein
MGESSGAPAGAAGLARDVWEPHAPPSTPAITTALKLKMKSNFMF